MTQIDATSVVTPTPQRPSVFGSKYLPDGSQLSADDVRRRARVIEVIVWLHVPLLVAVAVQRHVVGGVRNTEIGENAFVRGELRQPLAFDPRTDLVCVVHRYFYTGRRICHLPQGTLAEDIERPDNLKGRFPIPYVGVEFEVLTGEIGKCEAHICFLLKMLSSLVIQVNK